MAASRLDEIYIQCNKLQLSLISTMEFRLWGLHYFTHHVEYSTVYWIVRAAILDACVTPDASLREIARLVVLEVNERTEPYRPPTSGGNYPGEG